jgi:hypothetical protein
LGPLAAIDPACLSYAVSKAVKGESKRYIHYWVKDSLFKNPIAGAILLNAGPSILSLESGRFFRPRC